MSTEASTDCWMLTADEFAEKLGVARSTIYRFDAAGKIPQPIKIGNCCRWRAAEILDWIRAGCPPRTRWQWDGKRH